MTADSIILNNEQCYTVEAGFANLFVIEKTSAAPILSLGTYEAGQVFLSFACPETANYHIIAKPSYEAVITSAPLTIDTTVYNDSVACAQIEHWVKKMHDYMQTPRLPYNASIIAPQETTITLKKGTQFCSKTFLWLSTEQPQDIVHPAYGPIDNIAPILPGEYYQAKNNVSCDISTTSAMLKAQGKSALKQLWSTFFNTLPNIVNHSKSQQSNTYRTHQDMAAYCHEEANNILTQSLFFYDLDTLQTDAIRSNVHAAISLLCRYLKISTDPVEFKKVTFDNYFDEVNYITDQMQLQTNKIALEENWYKNSGIPYLGFYQNGDPCVLLPRKRSGYVAIDPKTNTKQRVTKAIAATIEPTVVIISPNFSNAPVTFKSFLRQSWQGNRSNFIILAFSLLAASLLALITPIITGYIIDKGIPHADFSLIIKLSLLLVSTGICTGLFILLRSIALVRFETIMNYNLQSAAMDRLLKLPVNFFSKFESGDITNRILSMDTLVKALSGSNIDGTLTFIFSCTNFFIMFYYAPPLAIIVLLIVIILITLFIYSIKLELPYTQAALDGMGNTFGFLFQAINGIRRIRILDKATVIFKQWCQLYGGYRRNALKAYLIGVWRSTIFSVSKLATLLLLFIAIVWWYHQAIPLRNFITFISALIQFATSLLIFSTTASSAFIPAIILYRRIQPILTATPEFSTEKRRLPITLQGGIIVKNLSFRYDPQGPDILQNINFDIQPGDCIGIFGPSDSGKSTLLKVLLGFFPLSQGSILYDKEQLPDLNIRSVRKQIGTALQNGELMTGSIFENIAGNSPLTEADVWQLLKIVGLQDDVLKFPMGVHTRVSHTAEEISTSQKQQILIARALANTPRILFLDNTTSDLDEAIEKQIIQNMQTLNITRLICTRRILTLKQMDYILVLDQGKIVEKGTFDMLMADSETLFHRMIKLQKIV